MEAPMVQVARTNGHGKRKSPQTYNAKRVITCYKKHGRSKTLKRYPGLTDPTLYGILHRAGVALASGRNRTKSKARRAVSRAKPGGRQGSGNGSPRASYKAAGAHKKGAGIGDAVVYLTHALDRLEPLGRDVYPIAGLIGLALEALGAR